MRRLLLIALALGTFGLSACGEQQEIITVGESEAEYVTQADLQYQVQMSRQLNPFNPGDRNYLVGLPVADRGLQPDEIWFGVWMRVGNTSGQARARANEFRIIDTRGNIFEPIPLAATNVFAYRNGVLPNDAFYPLPNTAPGQGPNNGALVLFKLPVEALSFRPLELEFSAPGATGQPSQIRLDV